jgi:hypothetical protein
MLAPRADSADSRTATRLTSSPSRKLLVAAATLAAGAVATLTPTGSAATSTLAPEALTRAHAIRAAMNARYRQRPGRKLAVTEATSTGVVKSLTLMSDGLQLARVVPADNGIYFAICPARASCPYPARSAARPATDFLPCREAFELALRTFLETSVTLVVVALPTAQPVWIVFERDDFVADIDTPAVRDQLASNPAVLDLPLRELVRQLTWPRLFAPLPILPPPDDTIYAVSMDG